MTARLAISALSICLLSSSAQACVESTGPGPASDWYLAARFGMNPLDGMKACNLALEEGLLTREDRAGVYDNRGVIKSAQGAYDQAMEDFEQSLQLNPILGDAHLNRGTILIRRRDFAGALPEIALAFQYGISRPEAAYFDRAIAEEGLGQLNDAYRDYKKASEVAPYFTAGAEQLKRFTVVKAGTTGG